MSYDDDWYDRFDGDVVDDPNMWLPSYFITAFENDDLPVYKEAINRFCADNPGFNFDIDLSGSLTLYKQPALYLYERPDGKDLTEFWKVHETVKRELRGTA